ncbi:MbnB/TglH/ChrH family RiPP precursor modification enzyme [Saccharothrix stipae]
MEKLGVGIGWRPEIDLTVERLPGVDFVEVVAENLHVGHLPESVRLLRERGVPVLPHAVSLSLGGAEPVDAQRVAHLGALAEALDAPLVSDHVCFVRAGGLDSGHLMPLPRTRDALDVLVANVKAAQQDLPVPLALENVAALLEWPDGELTEGQFLAELVDRTDCHLLIDVANLYANARNLGTDVARFLDEIPLERLAYVHVAGGEEHQGVYHDTHAHAVLPEVLDVLAQLRARVDPPGVLLERDDDYPANAELAAELAAIRAVLG